MEPIELIRKKKHITVEDFKECYPNQGVSTLRTTATRYMRPLRDVGIVERNGKGWVVKHDLLKTIEEFERIRKKMGYEGDLFEFITHIFKKTREIMKVKTDVEVLAEKHNVSPQVIMELLETVLDEFIWKTEEDLKKLAEDIRSGRIVFLADRVRDRFYGENREDIEYLSLNEGMTEDEALIFLLNNFLSFVPVSLSLWREVERVAGEGNSEIWVKDKLIEENAGRSYELIPVNKKLFDAMEKEVGELAPEDAERLKEKFVKGINSLMEKVRKEAKEMKIRKISRRK